MILNLYSLKYDTLKVLEFHPLSILMQIVHFHKDNQTKNGNILQGEFLVVLFFELEV